jgi:senataxin
MNEIKEQLVKVQKEIENLKAVPNFDVGLLNKLYDKRSLLHSQFSDIKTIKMNDHEKFNQIVESILASADIICCTLASAGSDKLEKFREYIEAVIVDEASQCTEPSNIIPLQYSPKKLILIGDPKQLPATTFSQDAYKTNFNRSLFEVIPFLEK